MFVDIFSNTLLIAWLKKIEGQQKSIFNPFTVPKHFLMAANCSYRLFLAFLKCFTQMKCFRFRDIPTCFDRFDWFSSCRVYFEARTWPCTGAQELKKSKIDKNWITSKFAKKCFGLVPVHLITVWSLYIKEAIQKRLTLGVSTCKRNFENQKTLKKKKKKSNFFFEVKMCCEFLGFPDLIL